MTFKLPELPFPKDALTPHMSPETLDYHHGKHHKAYVDKLNQLVPGTEWENKSLEDIIRKATGPIFNNGAQIWNHTFFWNCLTPKSKKAPSGVLMDAIHKSFENFEQFQTKFNAAAVGQFGSGWAWLVKKSDGSLAIQATSNAENPLRTGDIPLFTCDVWEHAYYIDYRNERAKFVQNIWNLANWDFVESNFKTAK